LQGAGKERGVFKILGLDEIAGHPGSKNQHVGIFQARSNEIEIGH
jgi:hypothetical protein